MCCIARNKNLLQTLALRLLSDIGFLISWSFVGLLHRLSSIENIIRQQWLWMRMSRLQVLLESSPAASQRGFPSPGITHIWIHMQSPLNLFQSLFTSIPSQRGPKETLSVSSASMFHIFIRGKGSVQTTSRIVSE